SFNEVKKSTATSTNSAFPLPKPDESSKIRTGPEIHGLKSYLLKLALTFLFLSRCLRTATAFLINPFDLRILKILLPVTKRTWATPWESLRITPETNIYISQ
uniref:Uncharacterized protein n=1 Tax=Aquila chrysaetos chrysaetos TaxID=223781 RepID=A0A663F3M1_AQUCH